MTTTTTTSTSVCAYADPRPTFASALDTARQVIAGVRPDQLDDSTPCTEMDVRRLLGHLTGIVRTVAAVGRGEDIFAVADQEPAADDAWLDRFDANRAELEAAWETGEALDRPTLVPWAAESGALALVTYANEVTVHTWDLATATGQRPSWDPAVLEMAAPENFFPLPAENRAALFAEFARQLPAEFADQSAPFLDAVPVADDAPLIDRIIAWSGRRPDAGRL